jgi:hypothetical protein
MRMLYPRRFALLIAIALCPAPYAMPMPPPKIAAIPGQWEHVWGDEFDGTQLDLSKWSIGHWWEREDLGLVTHSVSGGYLRLYPRVGSKGKLISRTITTDGKYHLPTGTTYYVEFKARLPAGPGRWPALWLFSHDDYKAPSRPELDIMETGTSPPWGDGRVPLAVKATSFTDRGMSSVTHKPIDQRGQHSNPRAVSQLTTMDHTFGALVNPSTQSVIYFVDGDEFARHTLDSTRSRLYIVISDQYDGPFNQTTPADPAATIAAPIPFIIDYVRVFEAR